MYYSIMEVGLTLILKPMIAKSKKTIVLTRKMNKNKFSQLWRSILKIHVDFSLKKDLLVQKRRKKSQKQKNKSLTNKTLMTISLGPIYTTINK